ncbi:MAG: GNAT family protein [Polyangiaceae bacterium]
MSRFDPKPITLTGEHARLVPLTVDHVDALLEAARDPSIWTYMPILPIATREDAQSFVEQALQAQSVGDQVPFAILDARSGAFLGSTRYMEIRRPHRGLEIGATWLTPAVWRTAINTDAKRLLLGHAFEELDALRVQLKTDARNVRSQTAIARIGGVREGTLRAHMLLPTGHVRDTVYFSVIASEWPAVKANLGARLAADELG